MISFMNRRKRIMTREALESGRLQSTIHNSNREFISILTCIYTDRTSLPARLIYEGNTGDLQST
jgi:hypothetical protein